MVNWLKRNGPASVTIMGLVFLIYWPVLRGQFVWDDHLLVGDNPLVTGKLGFGSVWFQTGFPLTTVAFWLQWLVWGSNPTPYHVINVLLHGLDAVLVWRLLARLKLPGAWLGAVFFAVHPVCVTTVGWISELKNTMSLMFFLLSFLWYLQMKEEEEKPTARVPDARNRARLIALCALSLAAFLLSLLSKTSTVVLPLLLLGWAWWRHHRLRRRDWLQTAPYFALSLVFGLMTIWFQQRDAIKGITVQVDGFWGRLAGAGWAVWFYLGKALAPVNLSFIYPHRQIDTHSACSYLPVLLLVGVFALCWWFRDGWGRHILFGLGCYVIALLPVLGFLDMYYLTISRVSDHFQYLALIAVAAAVAAGLVQLDTVLKMVRTSRRDVPARVQRAERMFNFHAADCAAEPRPCGARAGDGAARHPYPEQLVDAPLVPPAPAKIRIFTHARMMLTVVMVAGLSLATFQRAQIFATEEGLYRDTLARNPSAWPLSNDLGCISVGRHEYAAAREQFEQSLRANPRNAGARLNLGRLLAMTGHPAAAEAQYRAALKLNPQNAEAQKCYATALLGQGRAREALPWLRAALQSAPDADTRIQYAAALQQVGDVRLAVTQLRLALAAKPDSPEALNDLAWLLATSPDETVRRGPEAVTLAERACRLTHYQTLPMLATLSAAYAETGHFPDAVATGEKLQQLAVAANDRRMADVSSQLLALYRAGKPYHGQ